MRNLSAELRKNGSVKLPNGATVRREGKSVVYEANQPIRVTLPSESLDSAEVDQPMIVLLESMMGLKYTDLARRIAMLTPRELQVFGEMGLGFKNRKIAESLGISPKTLDIHRANIGRKLGFRTANAFGRAYWFFRLCHEFYPQTLEDMRREIENE